MESIVIFLLCFLFYSFFGWFYETLLCSIQERKFVNRGFLTGPYCPVYGFGAMLDILLLGRVTNPFLLFFLGAVLTCALEYITSYGMEKLFHAKWWDYSGMRFHLNGRICLLGALAFGIFSLVLILWVHPALIRVLKFLPRILRWIGAVIFVVMFSVDCVVTGIAMTDFQKILEEVSLRLADTKNFALTKIRESTAYNTITKQKEVLTELLGRQRRRIILAFPKMKLHKHNELLVKIREILQKHKK